MSASPDASIGPGFNENIKLKILSSCANIALSLNVFENFLRLIKTRRFQRKGPKNVEETQRGAN
jgi:hypothetical protein